MSSIYLCLTHTCVSRILVSDSYTFATSACYHIQGATNPYSQPSHTVRVTCTGGSGTSVSSYPCILIKDGACTKATTNVHQLTSIHKWANTDVCRCECVVGRGRDGCGFVVCVIRKNYNTTDSQRSCIVHCPCKLLDIIPRLQYHS